nr:MAG TPA: A-macroglobulin receptor binding domain protein [Caudoviricetes sp.]
MLFVMPCTSSLYDYYTPDECKKQILSSCIEKII